MKQQQHQKLQKYIKNSLRASRKSSLSSMFRKHRTFSQILDYFKGSRLFEKFARSAFLEKTYLSTRLVKPYTGTRIANRVFLLSGLCWERAVAVFSSSGPGPGILKKTCPKIGVSFAKSHMQDFSSRPSSGSSRPSLGRSVLLAKTCGHTARQNRKIYQRGVSQMCLLHEAAGALRVLREN